MHDWKASLLLSCWCACNFEAKVDSVNSPTNKLISFSLACKPEFCFDIVNLSDTVTPDILTWVDAPGCACAGFDDGYEFKSLGIETLHCRTRTQTWPC
jgi:hypothetical protein